MVRGECAPCERVDRVFHGDSIVVWIGLRDGFKDGVKDGIGLDRVINFLIAWFGVDYPNTVGLESRAIPERQRIIVAIIEAFF